MNTTLQPLVVRLSTGAIALGFAVGIELLYINRSVSTTATDYR